MNEHEAASCCRAMLHKVSDTRSESKDTQAVTQNSLFEVMQNIIYDAQNVEYVDRHDLFFRGCSFLLRRRDF